MKGPDKDGGIIRAKGFGRAVGIDAEFVGDPDVSELARQRGIRDDVLRAAGIRRDTGGGKYDGWWRLPYPHRSGVWKVRYRNPDPKRRPKYLDDPGAQFHLYNPLRLGAGEDEVWFAEGEFDTLCLIDQGFKAIGIHGIKSVQTEEEEESEAASPEEGKRFRKSWKRLFEGTNVIVMFDNDKDRTKGPAAGRRLARGLNGHAFDEWPDDYLYTDINEWHLADPEGLGDALRRFSHRLRVSKGMAPWG